MNRIIVAAALAAGFIAGGIQTASAEWPSDRPIRLIIGFGAGGGTDIAARIIAEPLGKLLNTTVVVENKPGAGGTIASEQVARADKDGYTASMISTGHTVGAVMLKAAERYDAVKDFAPVSVVANSTFVVVANKNFAANDVKGLIALAKASPGKLNFASVGVGSTQNMAGELLVQLAGINVKHIPYRGSPALVGALLAGEVDYAVETFPAVQGQVQAGTLKLLGVGSAKRVSGAPDVPTVGEAVPGYAVSGWYGWVYPAGVPKAVVDKTHAALKTVLSMPEIREKMSKIGGEAATSTPQEFTTLLADEVAKWKAVRDKAGMTPK